MYNVQLQAGHMAKYQPILHLLLAKNPGNVMSAYGSDFSLTISRDVCSIDIQTDTVVHTGVMFLPELA